MAQIRVYTEPIIAKTRPSGLANSVHMALRTNGEYEPLHSGYGILFPKADISGDNTILERGIRNPGLLDNGDCFLVLGEIIDASGNPMQPARFAVWETRDFIRYEPQRTLSRDELTCLSPESGSPADSLPIPDELVPAIRNCWFPIHSVSVSLPADVAITTSSRVRESHAHVLSGSAVDAPTDALSDSAVDALADALSRIPATITYSDGSTDTRNVSWDMGSLAPTGRGTYRIHGTLTPIDTGFPLAPGYADPVLFYRDNAWYFLATNDNVNDIGLFVRTAPTIPELFNGSAQESCILGYDEARGFCQTFWAPEFHVIHGELYILFAVSGTQWGPQCHLMHLRAGGNIMNPADWETPIRICRADGRPLAKDGITLDMTYIHVDSGSYVCWSYRHGIGTPADTGSMLYIARIDDERPWMLTSEPVLLSRPEYGWENTNGTINNEGPYALVLGNQIYLAHSGGDACGYLYAVGYHIADVHSDLTDPQNWTKLPTALFHSLSVPGIQGPGHNSFFRNSEGKWMIAYHAQEREKYNMRCSAIHRVHISADGFPMLNVVGDRDIAPELRRVALEFRLITPQ